MGRPAKFTRARRERLLELLGAGASRRSAALAVGIAPSTLTKWLRRGGEKALPGSQYRAFRLAVLQAEADPQLRALKDSYDRMADDPDLAWRFIERREPSYPGGAGQDGTVRVSDYSPTPPRAPAREFPEGDVS